MEKITKLLTVIAVSAALVFGGMTSVVAVGESEQEQENLHETANGGGPIRPPGN